MAGAGQTTTLNKLPKPIPKPNLLFYILSRQTEGNLQHMNSEVTGNSASAATKRVFDAGAALGGLLLLWPVIIVLAIVVRATSPGGAFLRQRRVGRNERPFTCYKLRTMFIDVPQVATHDAKQNWVTPFGAFLRRAKLDELPQLWNVLRGDMSLVGPRPCLPNQSELIEARRAKNVFSVRPGVTGLAQVRGIDMSTPGTLADVDAQYIATRSFSGDLRLIFATILPARKRDEGAD